MWSFEHFLILISDVSVCVSISAFALLIGVSVCITSSALGFKTWAISTGLKRINQFSARKGKTKT